MSTKPQREQSQPSVVEYNPDDVKRALIDVDFTALLRGKRLQDNATKQRVLLQYRSEGGDAELPMILRKGRPRPAGSTPIILSAVPPDAFIGVRAVQFSLNKHGQLTNASHQPVLPFIKDNDDWFEASRQRVRMLIDALCTLSSTNFKSISDDDVEANQLVSISATDGGSGLWEDEGVFYYGDKAVKGNYIAGLRRHSVHPMGRAALMQYILFAIAGINKMKRPYFECLDVWEGRSTLNKGDLLACLRRTRSEATEQSNLVDVFQVHIDALEEPVSVLALMETESLQLGQLTENAFQHFIESMDASVNMLDMVSEIELMATEYPQITDKDLVNFHKFLEAFYANLSKLAVTNYKKRLAEKMQHAVFIKRRRWGKAKAKDKAIDTQNGIYGVYTPAVHDSGITTYLGPQRAVAASFRGTRPADRCHAAVP